MASRSGGGRIAGLALLFAAFSAQAAAGGIAPHQAFYEIGLVRAGPSSGIDALSGAAVYEWSSGCDRIVLNRETRMSIQPLDEAPVSVRVEFSAWERLDGLAYGFAGRTVRNGVETEARSGAAHLERAGGAGEAVYSRPRGLRLPLEPGTMFPAAWVRSAIDHARDGEGLLTSDVFFGEDEDALLTASMLVLPAHAAGDAPEAPAALDGLARWRAQLAFFNEGEAALPAFEATEWFYENGVGGDAVLAFPEFTIRYRLRAVELHDPPDC